MGYHVFKTTKVCHIRGDTFEVRFQKITRLFHSVPVSGLVWGTPVAAAVLKRPPFPNLAISLAVVFTFSLVCFRALFLVCLTKQPSTKSKNDISTSKGRGCAPTCVDALTSAASSSASAASSASASATSTSASAHHQH